MADDSWPSTHLSLLLNVKDPENEGAWTEFVARYRSPIIRLCVSLFGIQTAVAEDIAQDVLLKLVKEMQRFEYHPERSFSGWLKTVTKNSVRDYFRKEKRRLDAGMGDSKSQELLQQIEDANGSDAIADALAIELQRDLFEAAERQVRERVDKKTWLAYRDRLEGKRARQIADDLGMKVAAVHKANSRVLRMIREETALLLRSQKPK